MRLLGRHALSLYLFLLSDGRFVLGNLRSSALAAPSLALSRTEIVCPIVALAAVDLNKGALLHLRTLHDKNLDTASVSLRLRPHGLHYFNAIVAYLMLGVSELPESDLATMAGFLLPRVTIIVGIVTTKVMVTRRARSCSRCQPAARQNTAVLASLGLSSLLDRLHWLCLRFLWWDSAVDVSCGGG